MRKMQHSDLSRAFLAGFVATAAMTAFAYLLPYIGLPQMDFAAMLGSLFVEGSPVAWSTGWWIGMVWHFINGAIIFPLIYAIVIHPIIPGKPTARGIVFSLLLVFFSGLIVLPFFGRGIFFAATDAAVLMSILLVAVHLIYGAVLGAIAGPQVRFLMKKKDIPKHQREKKSHNKHGKEAHA